MILYEFEIHYGEIEEPLYLTNDKNYICDYMSDYIEELGIELNEIIYKVNINMKIERIMPSVMGIIIIALLALATSCATNQKMVGNYYNHTKYCPAYN